MTSPRRMLVCESDTPYYHIVSRCVRRAFLCGKDQQSGKNYEHRRHWVEDRVRILSSVFAVDVCAYAVMSNHYHLVLKLDSSQAEDWSDYEVALRWTALFKGPILLQGWVNEGAVAPDCRETLNDMLRVYRKRLCSLSWFMKCLNEPIARRANREDGCTGHFWEARFKSQAIRSEADLMACMAYVDLNPVRATMAPTPESSEYTSVRERIKPSLSWQRAVCDHITEYSLMHAQLMLKPLLPFRNHSEAQRRGDYKAHCLPFTEKEYLSLVDWTGRIAREDKHGRITSTAPPILDRIRMPPEDWLQRALNYEAHRGRRHRQTSLT